MSYKTISKDNILGISVALSSIFQRDRSAVHQLSQDVRIHCSWACV